MRSDSSTFGRPTNAAAIWNPDRDTSRAEVRAARLENAMQLPVDDLSLRDTAIAAQAIR